MKYLIAGLGNIGPEYTSTRHNIGFTILDTFSKVSNISFEDTRYAFRSVYIYKGRSFILIKPSTYVNLSGRAVNYWLKKEKIHVENLLIIVDDISLPFGVLRLRPRGGNAGHNGLTHISMILGTQNYPRLRFGIGSDFPTGTQVNYVLGTWTEDEQQQLPERITTACEIIKSFGTAGIEHTMNHYNNK